MRGPVDRIAAFVDDLLHNRRPCRFNASPEEMGVLRAAAELTSARPGADLPDRDFIDRLGRQLRSQMEPRPAHESVTRRALLRTAGLAAAAGVAGAVIDPGGRLPPSQTCPRARRFGSRVVPSKASSSTTAGPSRRCPRSAPTRVASSFWTRPRAAFVVPAIRRSSR